MRLHRLTFSPLLVALALTGATSDPAHAAPGQPKGASPSAVHLAAPATPLPTVTPEAPGPAWAGVIELSVDAGNLAQRLLRVRQTLPLPARPAAHILTLHYPRYLPGGHGPYGDVSRLAGLQIEAQGQRLSWQRDAADPHLFQVQVPAGVARLLIQFQYLTPVRSGGDRLSITRDLLGLEWENVVLAPAGAAASRTRVSARVKLPQGWRQASALRAPDGSAPVPDAEGWLRYREVSLETLIDSPLFAGRHLRRVELDPPGTPQAAVLNLLADEAGQLDASEAQLDAHRRLLRQAVSLFGSRPWRHYDFLLALSDEFGGIGLEHHESSENGVTPDYFKDWDKAIRGRELLAHELVHAWNGKLRRPADLWTPDYQTPMRTSLLWVYEGQTQYWGHVLAARSGLSTQEQARDRLAWTLAELQARPGRSWRPLQDTTLEPAIGPGHSHEWDDWQRGGDYYDEGLLLWLDVDTQIREASDGKRSLDDFAKSFLGGPDRRQPDGSVQVSTYTFAQLVQGLNAVQPLDWATFLRSRLDHTATRPALDEGLRRAGWHLVWRTEESSFATNERGWSGPNGNERPQDLAFSLGLRVTSDGKLDQVFWDSPAFRAGLAPGMTLLAVNGRGYKPERLSAAVAANTGGQAPLQLIIKDGDHFLSVSIDWRGGLRYPALERLAGQTDRLSTIYAPR